jgi:hypothetical protein
LKTERRGAIPRIPTITRIKIHNMREAATIAIFQPASELHDLKLKTNVIVSSPRRRQDYPWAHRSRFTAAFFLPYGRLTILDNKFDAADFLHSLERGAAPGACGFPDRKLDRPAASGHKFSRVRGLPTWLSGPTPASRPKRSQQLTGSPRATISGFGVFGARLDHIGEGSRLLAVPPARCLDD